MGGIKVTIEKNADKALNNVLKNAKNEKKKEEIKAKLRTSLNRFYDILIDYMHTNCFELIESERYNKNNPKHIEIMSRLNTKDISYDELAL
jgi:hypothetical protein